MKRVLIGLIATVVFLEEVSISIYRTCSKGSSANTSSSMPQLGP
jgi:hypothetical protein